MLSERFDGARSAVIAFMVEEGYSKSYISETRCALRELGEFLEASGSDFTEEAAHAWLEGVREDPRGRDYSTRRVALVRLCEAMASGKVTTGRFPNGGPARYLSLPAWAREVVDAFAPTTCDPGDARSYCSQFLVVACAHGADGPGAIAPEHVAIWIASLPEDAGPSTNWQRMSFVRRMLAGLGDAVGDEAACLVDADVLLRRDMLAAPAPGELPAAEPTATAREFLEAATELRSRAMPGAGYGETSVGTVRTVGNVLFSFLALNGLGFSAELGLAWVGLHADGLGGLVASWRRAVLAIDVWAREGRVAVCEVLVRADPMGGLPPWAREDVRSYLELRRREGLAESSLRGCLWSCVLLAAHADECGASSFAELTPAIVAGFACGAGGDALCAASRALAASLARGFLRWLADGGVVPQSLELASSPRSAPSVRVVSVPGDEQVARIREFRASAATPMELRDAAMVSLGLWEGLRACDVVALRLDAIDWRASKVTVVQRKTGAQLELPLMPEAGNSVAEWLLRGRPECDSPNVFVRAAPPHVALVGTNACSAALRRALGDLYGRCGGFHELRRTYATDILRGGAGPDGVAEALGHRCTAATRAYLALDDERMALCAMPLGAAGAPGGR